MSQYGILKMTLPNWSHLREFTPIIAAWASEAICSARVKFARELMTNAPSDARVALYTWVDGGNQMAPHLVEQEGFTLLRYFLQMEIEMDAPPPVPTWPSGITVRTFSPGKDDHAVFDATEDAFRDELGMSLGILQSGPTGCLRGITLTPRYVSWQSMAMKSPEQRSAGTM